MKEHRTPIPQKKVSQQALPAIEQHTWELHSLNYYQCIANTFYGVLSEHFEPSVLQIQYFDCGLTFLWNHIKLIDLNKYKEGLIPIKEKRMGWKGWGMISLGKADKYSSKPPSLEKY